MSQIYLTRRNLLTLISKLDRKSEGEETACTLIKYRDPLAPVTQTMKKCKITAVEDDEFYVHRSPGEVHRADEERLRGKKNRR